jgi:hypothetical protein
MAEGSEREGPDWGLPSRSGRVVENRGRPARNLVYLRRLLLRAYSPSRQMKRITVSIPRR